MEQQNAGSKRSASGGSGRIAAKSHEAAEQLKETVIDEADRVREKARSAKEHTGERIRGVASQLSNMSNSLRETDPLAAGLAERASRGIESVAEYVTSSDARTLVRDTEQLARRQPALFFGSAFLIGLAAGRFLKSSAPRSNGSGWEGEGDRYATRGGPLARTGERDSGFYSSSDRQEGFERNARSNRRYQENYDATFARDPSDRDTNESYPNQRAVGQSGTGQYGTSQTGIGTTGIGTTGGGTTGGGTSGIGQSGTSSFGAGGRSSGGLEANGRNESERNGLESAKAAPRRSES